MGEKMKESFLHLELTKVVGRPNYSGVTTLFEKICKNAATVDLDLGGGNHGLTGLLVTALVYAKMSNIPFIQPPNPGPMSDIINIMDVQAHYATLVHSTALKEY